MKNFNQYVNGVSAPHNPNYRLVGTTIFLNDKFIELVYGETNEGENEGLEVYFKSEKNGHHYYSRRYSNVNIPLKYETYFEYLKQFVIDNEVEIGHKLIVDLPNK